MCSSDLFPSHDNSGFLSVPNLQSWQANNDYANIFGYVRGDVNYKLLHMLNYGNIIPTSPAISIGNVIICFLFVIVTGIRICLWEFFLIPSLVI